MFFAAFTSRSCRVRQAGHVHARVFRGSLASRCPHSEQVLLLGNHRSMTTTVRPARWALFSSCRRNSPGAVSSTDRFYKAFRRTIETVASKEHMSVDVL